MINVAERPLACELWSKFAAIRKAVPAESANDELSWRNFPRMKSHHASKSSAAGPVTGHSSEVSTPTSVDPAKVPETGADRHGFPNRKAIVDKALEQFLSFEIRMKRQTHVLPL
jgi:hypothetical protein